MRNLLLFILGVSFSFFTVSCGKVESSTIENIDKSDELSIYGDWVFDSTYNSKTTYYNSNGTLLKEEVRKIPRWKLDSLYISAKSIGAGTLTMSEKTNGCNYSRKGSFNYTLNRILPSQNYELKFKMRDAWQQSLVEYDQFNIELFKDYMILESPGHKSNKDGGACGRDDGNGFFISKIRLKRM